MRGFVGLVIGLGLGLALGAGAMYLGLRRPWAGGGAAVVDAGPVAVVKPDAGKPRPGKHSHGGARAPRAPGASGDPNAPGDDGDDTTSAPAAPMIVLTAADRALEWRGEAVALPPQRIDVGAAGEARPLEQNEIEQTTSSQGGGVRDCVVHGATNTDLTATITVQMLVDGGGRVTRARVQAPHYLLDHGLYECTRAAVSRMHFPAVGGATIVTLPVTLS